MDKREVMEGQGEMERQVGGELPLIGSSHQHRNE